MSKIINFTLTVFLNFSVNHDTSRSYNAPNLMFTVFSMMVKKT